MSKSDTGPVGATAVAPPTVAPVTTVPDAIAQMQQIDTALGSGDGLGDFNRMYLGVTTQVRDRIGAQFFENPTFMDRLDVVFANRYFEAVGAALAGQRPSAAWMPLLERRHDRKVEAIQFALAGMNAHINFDLPLAVVATCQELGVAPHDGSIHADYQRVDAILDASEATVRESFEHGVVRDLDRVLSPVENHVLNWSMNAARDAAWVRARLLWHVRDDAPLLDDFVGTLARSVAFAGRALLVPSPTAEARSLFDRLTRCIFRS